MNWVGHLLDCACGLASALIPVQAARTDDFFSGKTITISSYDLPTEGYSQYVQLLTRHLGKHIPGNPSFVTTNKLGGGGLVAINNAAVEAPRDGTFLTMASQALLIYEGTGQQGLEKSLGEFHWLGSFTQSNNVTVAWAASGVKTLQDAIDREVRTGAVGAASASLVGPLIYNAVLGTKFKPVYGFNGMSEIVPAMRRGELESPGNNMWASAKRQMGAELRSGDVAVLLQTGLRKEQDLPDVPLFLDLVKGDPEKEPVAKFMSYAVSAARPLAAPPGTPPERVEILRRAFDATMKDPDFLADAAAHNLDIDPLTGEQVQKVITDVLATPASVRSHIRSVLGLPGN
jgi:tripartite-type tricarboxylate transporter receptor subunit TctC